MNSSKFNAQRNAVEQHRIALAPHRPIKQKLTRERIADLEKSFSVMKALWRAGCLVNHFYSTDANPVIMVEPCQNFKRFILGKAVHIDQHIKVGQVVQVFHHVEVMGVWIEWTALEVKASKKEEQASCTK